MVHRHNTYPSPDLTEAQRETLISICDALFQSHSGEEAERLRASLPTDHPEWQAAVVDDFIGKSYSELDGSIDRLVDLLGSSLSSTVRAELLTGLSLLSTTAGTFLLTGGCMKPFPKLTVKEREAILRSWSTSRITMRRSLMRAFAALGLFCIYGYNNVLTDAVGYPSPNRRLLSKPLTQPSYTYTFISPPAATPPSKIPIIQTEILIIGSGAGGGVVASRLAKSYKTLVVEKGVYAPTGERSRSQQEGFSELYQNGGLMASESGSTCFLAGSVFGGGTTVNWSGSLKTQHYVREEWAKKGLDWFLTDGYSDALDEICERMGVSSDHIKQNKSNSKLIAGCKKLGYHVDPIPQNTSGQEHACGFCSFGCPYGEKQGTVETFMMDAAKSGAEFLSRAQVERLLFCSPGADIPSVIDDDNLESYTYSTTRTRCIGAEMTLDDGSNVVVLASKSVIVSGGSINSPAILLRSGLKNPNIGKNLHCHPVTYVSAKFEDKINPWDGAIMTAVSNVSENRLGDHHGAKIEVCMSFPAGFAVAQENWSSSALHKSNMLEYNQSMVLIVLTRDRDSGQVFIDENGHPRIRYDISPYDGLSCLGGVLAAVELLLAAGAKKISTTQAGVPSYIVEEGHKGLVDPKWRSWIAQIQAAGVKSGWATFASAHQMGTCAMGKSASDSVVDPRGAVWGTSGLYVADASVFPTASGVNPMVTTMATAYSIAGFILEDLTE
ncbi:uncharacterized protein IL334_003838 [Kwoniella shivajii]|uniref:Long-chain-alcohol oxidase n=1 Tax=Kwoniella shivajii TaxID=564305 RepID=A0ABZ1D0F6_9TREE|nr:hypothetical protein IL334_003838 [Kwoniella shivajii]